MDEFDQLCFKEVNIITIAWSVLPLLSAFFIFVWSNPMTNHILILLKLVVEHFSIFVVYYIHDDNDDDYDDDD